MTHHRLEAGPDGTLVPAGELEEPLIVRPTSETIIGAMFAKWVQSYRDLPLLINQWANIVRWEMRTRLFLRTTEFLWQEGHTAHARSKRRAKKRRGCSPCMRSSPKSIWQCRLSRARKPRCERFPGAVSTYCIEAMMQDRKALQAGTSHFLGQNFSKASGIKFLDAIRQGGVRLDDLVGRFTRLIGGLIMTHGDDDGIIMPPRLAPAHVVILPIIHSEEAKNAVLDYCDTLGRRLRDVLYDGRPLQVIVDRSEGRGGDKGWGWIKKGIPLVCEVGPRDMEANAVFIGRRDRSRKERVTLPCDEFIGTVAAILDDIQKTLFQRALAYRDDNIRTIDSKQDFYDYFTPKSSEKPEIHGGFALCHWNGQSFVEEQVRNDLGVTIRCIPSDAEEEPGTCVISGKPSMRRVIFAKAY